jgi:hypothetical protein
MKVLRTGNNLTNWIAECQYCDAILITKENELTHITINGDDDYAEYELCIECDIPVVFYRIAEARGAKIYNEYKNAQ